MPEKADPVRVIGYRPQRTLAATAELEGVGFITGARVRVRFRPAPIDTGRVFRRTRSAARRPVTARVECVTGTDRRTTLGSAESRRHAGRTPPRGPRRTAHR